MSFRERVRAALSGVDPYPLLILLISLFAIGPLMQPGYFWNAHDARHSVYFLFEYNQGVQDGLLYPRWQPDFAFGYGYPFFNIYGPFSTFVGELFYLAGLGFTAAVKTVFGLAIAASGLAMYGFVKRVMGRQAGLVAAVAYMVIPYRLVDVYVRAALAESVAYVFIPLILWGTWSTLHRPRLASVLGLAFAYAALMVTHPLTSLLLTLILVFYVAFLALARAHEAMPWRQFSRESVLPYLGQLVHILIPTAVALVLGLGLSAFFAVPAMTEAKFVRIDQWYGGRYAWGGDFVEFFQLFSPRWGFGASVPGPDDTISFQLGAVPVVLGLFALVRVVWKKERVGLRRPALRLLLFFGVLTALVVFLMLGASAPLWKVLPLARLAQFPWRLLSLTVVSLAILSGAVVANGESPDRQRRSTGLGVPVLILIALLVLGSLPYMQAEMSEREVSLAGLMQFQQASDEMTGSTAWVQTIPTWSPMADLHVAGLPVTSKVDYGRLYAQGPGVHARTLELHVESELIEYLAPRPVLISFNTFYYPGWHAYLLDFDSGAVIQELPIAVRGELGLMTVEVPEGLGRVLLCFEDTPIRRLSELVSWGSLGLVAAAILGSLALRMRWGRRAKAQPEVISE